jgi:hypothetical protein
MRSKTNYTTTMKVLFLSWSFCFISFIGYSQLADPPICIEIIPHYEDPYVENLPGCGISTIDLEGYVTYRIYLVLQDPTDCVQAVFASDPFFGNEDDCIADSMDLCFNAPCGTFQHPLASALFTQGICLFMDQFPSLYYDSYMTLGKSCEQYGVEFFTVPSLCDSLFLENGDECDFFDGGNFYIDSNGIFNAGGLEAGEDLKVLIGQITTCGEICGKFGVGVLDNCTPGDIITYYSPEINFCQPNPCTSYPMTHSSSAALFCEGLPGITFFEGGMGYVNYQLYEAETNQLLAEYSQVQGDLVLDELSAGSYYLSMIDSVGCRDTSDVFSILNLEDIPEAFVASSSILGSLNCAGDSLADISVSFTGGTMPYSVFIDDVLFSFDVPQENYVFEDVSCGQRIVTIHDSLGCTHTEALEILCYEPLTLDIVPHHPLCFGGEGSVEVSAVNNFSATYMSWSDSEQFGPGGNVDLSATLMFDSIEAGVYSMYVLDSLACPSWYTVELTDPLELSCSISSSDEIFGNDAWACAESNGGTGPITYEWNTGSTSICIENLQAGEYSLLVTDENGCVCSSEVVLYTSINEDNKDVCRLLSSAVSEELTIMCKSEFEKFEIMDTKGSLVLSGQIGLQKSVSIQSLLPGKYFIKLFSSSSSVQLEFVKI